MMNARIFVAPLALALVACASNEDTSPRGIAGDGDPALGAPDRNAAGDPYPSENIGTSRGTRIANYKFLGYPDADPSKGLQPISLAQFYDPTGEKVKLIHIQAAGSWCTYCQQEMRQVVPLEQELVDRKVVWILSLAEGPVQGRASSQTDLDKWIATFKPGATMPHVLDPGNANLGPFYDAAALPWNANINAKTMEILSAKVGATTTKEQVLKDIDDAIAKVDK